MMKPVKLSSIKPNPQNPRVIKDEKFKRLVQSIQGFPAMMAIRPIVVDENNIILAGNMRMKALQELGHKEVPAEWVKKVDELTDEQKQEFMMKDNASSGEWDWDLLANNFEAEQLQAWNIDIPNWNVAGLNWNGQGEDVDEGLTANPTAKNEVLQYNIIFNDRLEYGTWMDFIQELKKKNQDPDATISQLLLTHLMKPVANG
jgi:hypothetical protein